MSTVPATCPTLPVARLAQRLDCAACGRWLVLTNVRLAPGEFIQGFCPKCKKERRFTAPA